MKQFSQIPLRMVGVEELVALAYSQYIKQQKKGKSSRRITLVLRPNELPPAEGVYQTFLGEVIIKAFFSKTQGRWFITVRLPDSEHFKLKDFLGQQP